MEANTYAIIGLNDGDLYSVHICSPLLAANDVFDNLDDAREYAESEARRLGLRKGTDEPSDVDMTFAAYDEDLFRKREHGPLYKATRRHEHVYVPAAEMESTRETCRRLATLNRGFGWEPSECGTAYDIALFANWWELEEVMA